MATRYVYEKTIRVEVDVLDEGEMWEGEPTRFATPTEQEESAAEYRDDAVSVFAEEEAPWVRVEDRDWRLVERKPLPRAPDG